MYYRRAIDEALALNVNRLTTCVFSRNALEMDYACPFRLHPDDLSGLNLRETNSVTVHGPAGSMHGVRIHPFEAIKPGNAAMYYPECNVLLNRKVDPQSKTPAFKCVVVMLETESLAVV